MKKSKNLPTLVLNKNDLINELKNREYSDKIIEDLYSIHPNLDEYLSNIL